MAVSIAAAISTPGFAEERAAEPTPIDEDVEVIEVTGIRGSMLRSMDLKREAKGIVDGISAEDIGKFPDTNLAESLQRITGIAIERDNGEGSKITVRGLAQTLTL
ncbi:TonB-dependent receptor plug domain-containing protein [Psychrosphaera algicola]|uniref:TonB-dependent receptor plug domain-containing protein n=1 Tax=Psychrosphaera algicola TaxID=3023714 RepID=A0ABT5FJ50_9GAMM|nr:TonB-dependent receptor plug domain-containing protein [Psychrosphaera sp. G1-22]MDC2891206.1 TonB-dependent receptor plug domain-containing protein [Psychrosphaera sp. G1-22]